MRLIETSFLCVGKRAGFAAWVLLSSALGLSCADRETVTQVWVMVAVNDDALDDEVVEVRFQVLGVDGDRGQTLDATSRSLRTDAEPIRISVVPFGGDATRQYEVTGEIFNADGELLGKQTVKGGYVDGEFREVWMVFDDVCVDTECPPGFRCQQGECVEYCVDPEPAAPDSERRSKPVPCGEPCEGNICETDPDQALRCEDEDGGYKVFLRECGFGCGDEECVAVNPSNVGDDDDGLWPQSGFASLEVGGEFPVRMVLNTEDGSIHELDDQGDSVEPPLRSAEGVGLLEGIGFQLIDTDETADCLDPELDPGLSSPVYYGVFSVERLIVNEGATLSATGESALVLLVNANVVIDGEITVAATVDGPGPGGAPGGAGSAGGGTGGGGLGDHIRYEFPLNGIALASGGAGGSYGSAGGFGGWGLLPGTGDLTPGVIGCTYGNAELTPLYGGSGGGAADSGATNRASGGHGGGALQISCNGIVVIGDRAVVSAAGSAGSGVNLSGASYGGSGGGSGGAVLLEAGEVRFERLADGTARLGAPGGGGGGASTGGQDGDPRLVPAEGGPESRNPAVENEPTAVLAAGGEGSDDLGGANRGQTGLYGGGGGGGAGRVRINTAAGPPDRQNLVDFVTPRGEFFTVGQARLKEAP